MSDEIKPVPPVYAIQPEFPPRVPERGRHKGEKPPAPTQERQESNGYDLSAITPREAKQLMDTELVKDSDALATPLFAQLKEAMERRATGKPEQDMDHDVLATASQRVAGLAVNTYEPPQAGRPARKTASGELLAKIGAFDALASASGKKREIWRG